MQKITGVLFQDDDSKLDRRIMDNNEERLRLEVSHGSAYIRTTAGEKVEWQNSHYHKHTSEFFVVVTGWMALAERGVEGNSVRVYRPGETVTSRPLVHHNVYLPAHAKIDTLKYQVSALQPGDKPSDWYPADPTFDVWTKSLTEQDIAEHAGVQLSELAFA